MLLELHGECAWIGYIIYKRKRKLPILLVNDLAKKLSIRGGKEIITVRF